MEILKYINKSIRRKYKLQEVKDDSIVIKFNNKADLVAFMDIAEDNNTVKTFNALDIWNKFVLGEIYNRTYKGSVCIEVTINDEENGYDYMIDYGYEEYYIRNNFIYGEVVEYYEGIIEDWSIE